MNDFLVYLLLNIKGMGALVAMVSFAFVIIVVSMWVHSDVEWKGSPAKEVTYPASIVFAISVAVYVLIPPKDILIKLIGG